MVKGLVAKSTGKWYTVILDDGRTVSCRIKGKFRLGNLKLTNPIAVGDRVVVEPEKDEAVGMITNVENRRNYVLRQSSRKKHYMHLIAANIDQAMLIITLKNPSIKLGFIDRFLLTTEVFNIPTYLIINKIDLLDEGENEMIQGLQYMYQDIGYDSRLVSAFTGVGKDQLEDLLANKTTLLAGHSGVGKSSIINMLNNTFGIKTQELSDYSGKGMHTTTFAEMFTLENGGRIIDTPGVKELGFNTMEPMDVAHNFREIFATSKSCKFTDCLHINEPNCAVKQAIEDGVISELRYQSYVSIIEEIQEQNAWERRTDW